MDTKFQDLLKNEKSSGKDAVLAAQALEKHTDTITALREAALDSQKSF